MDAGSPSWSSLTRSMCRDARMNAIGAWSLDRIPSRRYGGWALVTLCRQKLFRQLLFSTTARFCLPLLIFFLFLKLQREGEVVIFLLRRAEGSTSLSAHQWYGGSQGGPRSRQRRRDFQVGRGHLWCDWCLLPPLHYLPPGLPTAIKVVLTQMGVLPIVADTSEVATEVLAGCTIHIHQRFPHNLGV